MSEGRVYEYLNREVDVDLPQNTISLPEGVAVEPFGSGFVVQVVGRDVPQGEDFALVFDSLVAAAVEARSWSYRLKDMRGDETRQG